jgi:Carboxypeptidase regulatory-like domain
MNLNRLSKVVWLSLLVVCVVWQQAIIAAPPVALETGAVKGRVVDGQGSGVVGANVRIQESYGDKVISSAASTDDGRFEIAGVPVGCRRLVLVDAEGLGREFRDDVAIYPNHATDLGDIRALPGYVYHGRVVDAAGTPLAGITVIVEAFRHESGHSVRHLGPTWEIETGADGRFTSPIVPTCYANFMAKPPLGMVQGNDLGRMAGPDGAQFELPDALLVKETPLEGIVIDQLGTPIANADVWCNLAGCAGVKSDRQGHFALHGLTEWAAKRVLVWAEAPGFSGDPAERSHIRSTHTLVLHPSRHIVGRAIDAETGEPISIKRVVVCEVRRDADGTPHASGCGDVRFEQPRPGEFRAAVSPIGEKHLTVTADGYHDAEHYVLGSDLQTGEPEVTVKLRRKGTATSVAGQRIRGVVRSNREPAGQAWVSLWRKKKASESDNRFVRRGRTIDGTYRPAMVDVLTAADGSYLLDVTDPGEYYISARPIVGAPVASPALVVRSGEEITCDLDLPAGGSLSGRVNNVSPEQAERLWVVAFAHTPFCVAVPVNRDGGFTLEGLPRSEVGLKVGHEGYLDSDVPRAPFAEDVQTQISDPWKRAFRVATGENPVVVGIELEYPEPGPPDKVEE